MTWHVLQKDAKCCFVPLPRLSYIYWLIHFQFCYLKIVRFHHPRYLPKLKWNILKYVQKISASTLIMLYENENKTENKK